MTRLFIRSSSGGGGRARFRGTAAFPGPVGMAAPLLATVLVLALGACRPAPATLSDAAGQPGLSAPSAATPAAGSAPAPALEVAVASSDLAVGAERFAFGLMDEQGQLVPDARLSLAFFRIEGDQAIEAGRAPAHYFGAPAGASGLYVAQTRFDRAGVWGLEVSGTLADGQALAPQRLRFTVAGRSSGPALGEEPPDIDQAVLEEGGDPRSLSTDPHPDPDLYRMTVAQAKRSGRPSLLLFATPGLCQSEICLPVMEEVKAIKARYAGRINVLHLEVYASLNQPGELSPAMKAWGLNTEPWVYLLDARGRVAARLEGWAPAAEIEPLLQPLLP